MSSATLLCLLALCGLCCCFRCPPSWSSFDKSCYVHIARRLVWPDAVTICRSFGGHLVEINYARENDFVRSLIRRTRVRKAWIGINDLVRDGRWVLTSTGRPLTYTNWARGEPNNFLRRKQDCGTIYRKTGRWDDEICRRRFTFVCERKHPSYNPPKPHPGTGHC